MWPLKSRFPLSVTSLIPHASRTPARILGLDFEIKHLSVFPDERVSNHGQFGSESRHADNAILLIAKASLQSPPSVPRSVILPLSQRQACLTWLFQKVLIV